MGSIPIARSIIARLIICGTRRWSTAPDGAVLRSSVLDAATLSIAVLRIARRRIAIPSIAEQEVLATNRPVPHRPVLL